MDPNQASRIRVASQISLILIGVVVVSAALQAAQSFVAPVILALVFGVVLSPVSDMWDRIGFPPFVGALASLILTLLVIAFVAALALPVVERIAVAWPNIMGEMRSTMLQFQNAISGLNEAGTDLGEAFGGATSADTDGTAESETMSAMLPSTTDALFLAPSVAGQTVTFAGVLFFFLLTRRQVYEWTARRIAPRGMEHETARRLLFAERQVSWYFLTISIVNLGFGICVAIAMSVIGMPSPIIWGIATALLNFVLYLGPAIVFLALLVSGQVIFDGGFAFVPALVFLGLNLIEAQFVTPTAIGKTMSVNPLLIFVALVFFLWLWGPVGGFMAIPLLLWAMVLSNEINQSQEERRIEEQAIADREKSAASN